MMLLAGSPLLEDLVGRPDLLVALRCASRTTRVAMASSSSRRTMVEMELLDDLPFTAAPSREEWLARSQAGEHDVPGDWLDWARRWFRTSTLAPLEPHGTYFALIKCGRWLHASIRSEHPTRRSWTRELSAAWVAAVDELMVGEFSKAPNTDYMRARHGGELRPRSKASPDLGRCDVLPRPPGMGMD